MEKQNVYIVKESWAYNDEQDFIILGVFKTMESAKQFFNDYIDKLLANKDQWEHQAYEEWRDASNFHGDTDYEIDRRDMYFEIYLKDYYYQQHTAISIAENELLD